MTQQELKAHEKEITGRIKTFDDCLTETGETWNPSDGLPEWVLAIMKVEIIRRALNPKDWKADYSNFNQLKYEPWFTNYTAGVGFSGVYCAYAFTHTYCGSRLSYASEKLALYAGNQFLDIYNQFLTEENNGV